MPRTPQLAARRPKLIATGHRIRKGHYNFTVTYENGRRIPGWYQGSGPVVDFARYFGFDVEWRNVPWAKLEHEQQAAA